MKLNALSVPIRAQVIDRVVKLVQVFFKEEKGVRYAKHIIKRHIEYLVDTRGERVIENGGELLVTLHRIECQELETLLEAPNLEAWKNPTAEPFQGHLFDEKEDQFNGFRRFSPERIDAMIVHLAYKGKNLNPTKLNKLLFYGDFQYFRERDVSISGAEYTKLTHGPVFGNYDNELKILEKKRQVRIKRITSKGRPARIIKAKKSYRPSKSILSNDEIRFLDWVIETYDHRSTKELIAMSHREMAYWDTNWRQPINYDYAQYLEIKPPDSLLNS